MYAFSSLVNTDKSTNNAIAHDGSVGFYMQIVCKAFTLTFPVNSAANRHQYCYWSFPRYYTISHIRHLVKKTNLFGKMLIH